MQISPARCQRAATHGWRTAERLHISLRDAFVRHSTSQMWMPKHTHACKHMVIAANKSTNKSRARFTQVLVGIVTGKHRSTAMKIQIAFISNDAQTHKMWQLLWRHRPEQTVWFQKKKSIQLGFFKSDCMPFNQGRNPVMLWLFLLCVNSQRSCLMWSARLHKLLSNLLTIFTKVWQQWPLAAITYQSSVPSGLIRHPWHNQYDDSQAQ